MMRFLETRRQRRPRTHPGGVDLDRHAVVVTAERPNAVRDAIADAYGALVAALSVAVRSSADWVLYTADRIGSRGEHETCLNVRGLSEGKTTAGRDGESLRITLQRPRYRLPPFITGSSTKTSGYLHGVPQMVRSDLAGSGVAFTLDTESWLSRRGFRHRQLWTRRSRRSVAAVFFGRVRSLYKRGGLRLRFVHAC